MIVARPSSPSRGAIAALVVVAIGLIAAGRCVLLHRATAASNVDVALCVVPGSVTRTLQAGDDVVVDLDGEADFDLLRPGAPRHLRILAGEDVIEASGAEFRVVSTVRHVAAVDVIRGAVSLRTGDRTISLGAGSRWRDRGIAGAPLVACRHDVR